MKKLEIIIKPEKLEDLKEVLDSCEVNGMNIVNSMGYGNQKGIIKNYRGSEYAVNLLPKVKVETVVTDEVAPTLIDKIVKEINTGHFGDGKIFVPVSASACAPLMADSKSLHTAIKMLIATMTNGKALNHCVFPIPHLYLSIMKPIHPATAAYSFA